MRGCEPRRSPSQVSHLSSTVVVLPPLAPLQTCDTYTQTHDLSLSTPSIHEATSIQQHSLPFPHVRGGYRQRGHGGHSLSLLRLTLLSLNQRVA